MRLKIILMALFIAYAAMPLIAVGSSANAPLNDVVDRTDPNFIKASLLVVGPGNQFFGCAGHSSLRLECPTYKLDYCFSCETESIADNFGRFVMGKLKMGMFAVPTAEFLENYRAEGRGATQYPLQLPPEVKQRLWKLMDDKTALGHCIPYDYIKHCCVQTIIQPILEAIRPLRIEYAPWPEKYRLTRREILADNLSWCNWTRFFLHTIAGTEVDRMVSPEKTVILSPDFVELFRTAKVNGQPIITGNGEVVQPYQAPLKSFPVTPMMMAVLLLGVAIGGWWFKCRWIAWLFLLIQTSIGLLLTHLLLISSLPATEWNWLIVPFNPIPILFWHWRRYWAWPFVGVLVVWEVFMLLSPHQLTDPAYLVLALAYVLFYAKVARNP